MVLLVLPAVWSVFQVSLVWRVGVLVEPLVGVVEVEVVVVVVVEHLVMVLGPCLSFPTSLSSGLS